MPLINIQTNLKSISYREYQGPNTDTGSPLVTADINKNPSKQGIELEGSKRVDDLKRVTKLLTSTPQGVKFLANQSALEAAKAFNSTSKLNKKGEPRTKAGAALAGIGNTALSAAKVLGSTLAQIPVNGTGIHFVRGFAGKKGYLEGIRGHILYKNKSENGLYSDGESNIFQGNPLEELDDPKKRGKVLSVYVDKYKTEAPLSTFIPSGSSYLESNDITTLTRNKQIVGDEFKLEYVNTSRVPQDAGDKYNNLNVGFEYTTEERIVKTSDADSDKESMGSSIADYVTAFPLRKGNNHKDFKGFFNTIDSLNPSFDADYIDFNFKIIEPIKVDEGLPQVSFIPFRAYLTDFSDTYNANWNAHKYIGRAEDFYTYGGFSRSIQIGFQVAASSRGELTPLYNKLNALAGSTAPTYIGNSFMRGNLVALTVGDYLIDQTGVIESISLGWQTDYIWHTKNMNSVEGYERRDEAESLPTILDVSVTFTPVHQQVVRADATFIGRKNNIYVTPNEPSEE